MNTPLHVLRIVTESITHIHGVTPDMVQSAINKIKPGKSDCTDGMLSDNLTNRTLKLNMFISVLFFAMLINGIAPGGLLLSTLKPIPKIRERIRQTLIIREQLQLVVY